MPALTCLLLQVCKQRFVPLSISTDRNHSTGYDPRCRAYLHPDIAPPWAQFYRSGCSWKNLKVEARFHHDFRNSTLCPGFEQQTNPALFFRPGQIFAAQITSSIFFGNDRKFRKIDFGNLPLEPISKLKTMAETERLEDRAKRLAQIRQLPLERMAHYCKEIPLERAKVECLLCTERGWNIYPRDGWATDHFRIAHWRQYFGIIPSGSHLNGLRREKINEIIPWEKQKLPQRASDSRFSEDEWITLQDVIEDIPINSDEEIVLTIAAASETWHYLAGPVMIQRFVVVREGDGYCLCLGIHT